MTILIQKGGEVVGKAVVLSARLCNGNFLVQINFNLLGCLWGRILLMQKWGETVGKTIVLFLRLCNHNLLSRANDNLLGGFYAYTNAIVSMDLQIGRTAQSTCYQVQGLWQTPHYSLHAYKVMRIIAKTWTAIHNSIPITSTRNSQDDPWDHLRAILEHFGKHLTQHQEKFQDDPWDHPRASSDILEHPQTHLCHHQGKTPGWSLGPSWSILRCICATARQKIQDDPWDHLGAS